MNDGTVYEGTFKDDQFHGRGAIRVKVGGKTTDGQFLFKIFEGIFKQGLVPGEGKITYSDGSNGVYIGEHLDYEKHGYGYLTGSNISMGKYEGYFFEDRKNGMGL